MLVTTENLLSKHFLGRKDELAPLSNVFQSPTYNSITLWEGKITKDNLEKAKKHLNQLKNHSLQHWAVKKNVSRSQGPWSGICLPFRLLVMLHFKHHCQFHFTLPWWETRRELELQC